VRFGRLATIFTERMAMTVPGLRCLDLSPTIRRTAAIFWRRCGYRTVAARAMDTLLRSAYTELAAGEGTPGE
jgi:hypothetical protein